MSRCKTADDRLMREVEALLEKHRRESRSETKRRRRSPLRCAPSITDEQRKWALAELEQLERQRGGRRGNGEAS